MALKYLLRTLGRTSPAAVHSVGRVLPAAFALRSVGRILPAALAVRSVSRALPAAFADRSVGRALPAALADRKVAEVLLALLSEYSLTLRRRCEFRNHWSGLIDELRPVFQRTTYR